MNKYVVAFIDFFNNNLDQELVEAETATEAVKKSKFDLAYTVEDNNDYDKARSRAFDADSMFSVIKVS